MWPILLGVEAYGILIGWAVSDIPYTIILRPLSLNIARKATDFARSIKIVSREPNRTLPL